jgi:hypothetical protein
MSSRAPRRGAAHAAASAAASAAANALPASPSPSRRLPVSGAEDVYSDLTFGDPRGKGNNNCYAYAIDAYSNSGGRKLQPGNASMAPGGLDLGSCAALRARALADLRGRAYAADPDAPCRPGHYKVMAFLAPGSDYHWYKQHTDALVRVGRTRDVASLAKALGVPAARLQAPGGGRLGRLRPGDLVLVRGANLWSHKQGFATGPLLRDACDRAITDPRKACRDYGNGLDYKDFCGAMCVRSRFAGPPRRRG